MSFKSLSRPIEHNEYLRLKYGIGEATHERKLKKKKTIDSSSKKTNLKIFDDDIDLKKIKIKKAFEGDDEDDAYFGVEEDKPIIEEVIDERPLAVKNKDKEGTKWKPLSEDKEEKKDGLKSNHDTKGKEKKKQSEPIKHGLTTASVMKKERKRLKEQEAKLFKELGSEFLGKNAKSIYRDKTTGRVRDLEAEKMEEEAREKEIDEKEAAAKQKFKEMTVGIKQVEEKKAQLEDELHEMSKPFARYEDDADLDAYLRVRELADDPMLSYIRKKRKKEEEASGQLNDKKVILKYNGPTPPPPNRFNIPPGHRWDGVDRSNGYESKYFKQLSDKKSTQEEAYRWATEDM